MSSKRRIRRRSCGSKVGYDDKTAAVAAAGALRKKYEGGTYQAYRCEFCGRWHVGRPNAKERRATAARRAAQAT